MSIEKKYYSYDDLYDAVTENPKLMEDITLKDLKKIDVNLTIEEYLELAYAALEIDGSLINILSARARKKDYEDLAYHATINNIDNLKNIDISKLTIKNYKDLLLNLIIENFKVYTYVPEEFKNDRNFVLEAVEMNGLVLQYLPESFRNDKSIVIKAVLSDVSSFEFVPDNLKKDKAFITKLINLKPMILENLPKELENDREFIIELINKDIDVLEYLPEKLKSDRDIVIAAISKNGKNILFASKEFRNDKELAMIAINQNRDAIGDIGEKIREDREFGMYLLDLGINIFDINNSYYFKKLEEDKEFIFRTFIKYPEYCLDRVEFDKYNADRDFMLASILANQNTLKYASKELLDNYLFLFDALVYIANIDLFVDLTLDVADPEKIKMVLKMYNDWLIRQAALQQQIQQAQNTQQNGIQYKL